MAKKLLSPELNVVIKDIDNAREAINEKYILNGHPDALPAPLLSGDMAEAIRAIETVNELPVLDGNIEVSVDYKRVTLPGGYYKDGIDAKIKDYVVGYVWNRQGLEAKRQHVNIGDDFIIPDFLNGQTTIPQVPDEEFLGWSSSWTANEPHYLTGMNVSNFEFERNLDTHEYIAYLYAVWRKMYRYTLTYSANGGTGAPLPESFGSTGDIQHSFLLNTSTVPVKEQFKFIGWGATPDAIHYITTKTATAQEPNPVVYALWEAIPTVVYRLLIQVLDSTNNQCIPQQCHVKFREANKTSGIVLHNITTNIDGTYQTEEVDFEKSFKVEVSATGFNTDFFDVSFNDDEILAQGAERKFTLSPILQANEFFRVSTTWTHPNSAKDIDSHIAMLDGTDIIDYTHKTYKFPNGAILTLDADNTQGDGGAETITLTGSKDASFIFYVIDYQAVINNSSTIGIANRGNDIKVKYQVANQPQKEIRPTVSDTHYGRWDILKYENGTITLLNQYTIQL